MAFSQDLFRSDFFAPPLDCCFFLGGEGERCLNNFLIPLAFFVVKILTLFHAHCYGATAVVVLVVAAAVGRTYRDENNPPPF